MTNFKNKYNYNFKNKNTFSHLFSTMNQNQFMQLFNNQQQFDFEQNEMNNQNVVDNNETFTDNNDYNVINSHQIQNNRFIIPFQYNVYNVNSYKGNEIQNVNNSSSTINSNGMINSNDISCYTMESNTPIYSNYSVSSKSVNNSIYNMTNPMVLSVPIVTSRNETEQMNFFSPINSISEYNNEMMFGYNGNEVSPPKDSSTKDLTHKQSQKRNRTALNCFLIYKLTQRGFRFTTRKRDKKSEKTCVLQIDEIIDPDNNILLSWNDVDKERKEYIRMKYPNEIDEKKKKNSRIEPNIIHMTNYLLDLYSHLDGCSIEYGKPRNRGNTDEKYITQTVNAIIDGDERINKEKYIEYGEIIWNDCFENVSEKTEFYFL